MMNNCVQAIKNCLQWNQRESFLLSPQKCPKNPKRTFQFRVFTMEGLGFTKGKKTKENGREKKTLQIYIHIVIAYHHALLRRAPGVGNDENDDCFVLLLLLSSTTTTRTQRDDGVLCGFFFQMASCNASSTIVSANE